MVKGRYVATVELNFRYDENQSCAKPFEVVKEIVMGGGLDKAIVSVLSDEFGAVCSVGLNRQYADLWCVDGGINDDK